MATSERLAPPTRQRARRLSSHTATKEDVASGPTVVVPPRLLKHSNAHHAGFAERMSTARDELNAMDLEHEEEDTESPTSGSESPTTPISPDEIPTADSFAFAFDIDGVLIRGGRPIPEAIEAMKVLNGENEYNIKIPYIFLTNGGGKTENERCIDLSRQLDIEVSPAQFICGHTPMREMVAKYETVLIIGGEGEKCREVARGYGFKDPVTPGDILKDNAAIAPFRNLTSTELKNSATRDFSKIKIEAVFVFADSRDWASDLQILLDISMSKGGYIGVMSETLDEGPPIYFSHNDVVWSAAHHHVRLGMGALRKTLEVLYKDLSKGKELKTIAFGKPQIGTFEFATRLLQQWRKDNHRINRPPETVYFVGDTPESDIRGTNQFNAKAKNEWYSILVETGVFQEGTEPAYKPQATVNTVLDAVHHGIKREMAKKSKGTGAAAVNSLRLQKLTLGETALPDMPRQGGQTPIMERSETNTPVVQTPVTEKTMALS